MTKRKSAAEKAHSTHRKTAPKAATKKRGTYFKAAAPFEDLTRDAQMSEPLRTFAEKSMAHTRELCERPLEAVLESWERFVVAAGQSALALNSRAVGIVRRNINNGFGLVERLARTKNLAEAMELQAAYWRKQLGELAVQAGEIRTLSTKVTADVAAPIKAQVTRVGKLRVTRL